MMPHPVVLLAFVIAGAFCVKMLAIEASAIQVARFFRCFAGFDPGLCFGKAAFGAVANDSLVHGFPRFRFRFVAYI